MSCKELLHNISVLLVEDEYKLASLLKEAIGDHFAIFTLAKDGKEGLQKAEINLPDIVITDITMPWMNGLEMSALLRKKNPNLPIVILSAYSEKDYLLKAIDVGITKYLIKPFDPDELLEIVCALAKRIKKERDIRLLPPFHYNLDSGKLFKNNIMVRLSKRESRFIHTMLKASNYFMRPDEIKSSLWDEDVVSDERLRVFINRLRTKTDPNLIGNMVGQGYVINTKNPEKK